METLDLTGVPCPQNAARTLLKLALMDTGDLLKVIIDDGEPIGMVPESVTTDDHVIVSQTQLEDSRWVLIIEAD
jgi:tRNA 2-thiouridine synthesizing protein A